MAKNLIVAISDLHFEEEEADALSKRDNFPRNIPAQAFERLISDITNLARDENVEHIDFVLAGDIFDLHRTQLWFDGTLRPYVDCNEVDAALEAKILSVLKGIRRDADGTLTMFRQLFQRGKIDLGTRSISIKPHYFPGNHDRLANSTATIRNEVRDILGLAPCDDRFDHIFCPADPPILIRHGHEYDDTNFSLSFGRGQTIPKNIPESAYDKPTLGDFITVQVAAGLPFIFKDLFGNEAIVHNKDLKAIYARLLLFDDVRPQSKLIDFLLDTPAPKYLTHAYSREEWEALLWRNLEPVAKRLLNEIASDPFANRVLPFSWRLILMSRFWRLTGVPLWLAKAVSSFAGLRGDYDPAKIAISEEVLASEEPKMLVAAGHTHNAQFAHVGVKFRTAQAKERIEQFFVDTGTWRDVVLSAQHGGSFATTNDMTYLTVLWGDVEKPVIQYWSGYHSDYHHAYQRDLKTRKLVREEERKNWTIAP